ncbi:hypothetical protein AMAG_17752 [Allomyces macrogynus ATCC 38327]|uniref:BTB domain-containing protein n=1 Tax=Allomyces macrogynus (strain ATCC 38327) TaxID=578462 RepID=A0A0L0RYN7_ALLM3|nr:hypothetical protein AMAG_17752 [Allomyces macrogynus ATCC 38327]|eukprot:KNE55196.1 hypothetical protein AMAG_17752 [Allomyces macrogynus ATCC 38327]
MGPAPATASLSPSEPSWTSQVAKVCTKAVLRLVQVWTRPTTRPAAEPVLEALLDRMPHWRTSRFLSGFTLSSTAWKSVIDMPWDKGRYLPTLLALLKVCPAPPDVLAMLVTQLPRAIRDFTVNPALVRLIDELLSRTSSSQAIVEDRALFRLLLGCLIERAELEQLHVGAEGDDPSSVTFRALSALIKTCRASNMDVAHWVVDPRLCRLLVVALRALTAPFSSITTLSTGCARHFDTRSVLSAVPTVFYANNPSMLAHHLKLIALVSALLERVTIPSDATDETTMTDPLLPLSRKDLADMSTARKALKLVTQLWQVGNLIIEHGLGPLLDFSRTITQPNRIDAEQLPLLCMIWRQVTESSLARLKIRTTLARAFAETMAVLAHQVFAHVERGLVKFLPTITRPFIGDAVPLAHLAHVPGPIVIDSFLAVPHDHTTKHLVVLINTLGYAPAFQAVEAPHLVSVARCLLEVGYVDPACKWVENAFQLIPYQDQRRVLAQVLYPAVHDGHIHLVRSLLTTFDDKTTLKANHVLCRAAVFFLDPMRARRLAHDWASADLDWTDAAVRVATAVMGIWLVESGAFPTDPFPALDFDLHSPPAPAHPGTDHAPVTPQLHDGAVAVCRPCLARTSAAFSALLTGAFVEAAHAVIPIPDASAVTVHDFIRVAVVHKPLVDWVRAEPQAGYTPRALVHRLVDLAVLAERYLVEDVVTRVTRVLADLTDPRSAVGRACTTAAVGLVDPAVWLAASGGSATPPHLPTVDSPGAPDSPSYSVPWLLPGSPGAVAVVSSTTTSPPALRLAADPGAAICAATAQEWAMALLRTVLALDATPRGDDAAPVRAILVRFLAAHAAAAVGGEVAEGDEDGDEVE